MSDWVFEQGRWTTASTATRLRTWVTAGVRSGVRALGYDVHRLPKPAWANDPWRALPRLLEQVRRPVVFDVGANVGQTLERFSRVLPGAHVHSFEPFPASYEKLAAVAAARPPARAHRLALGAEPGEATFHVNPQFHTRNSLLTRPTSGRRYYSEGAELPDSVTVTVDTLDAFCAREGIERIEVLKLDVQGAELQVLQGGRGLLVRRAVDIVFSEVMFVPHYEGGPLFHDIHAAMRAQGYSLYHLYDPITAVNGQLRYANALFVSDDFRTRVLEAFPPEP